MQRNNHFKTQENKNPFATLSSVAVTYAIGAHSAYCHNLDRL